MNRRILIWLILCGFGIGFVNGFLGSGGGVLAVTALLTLLQLSQKKAQATALLIILPLSVVSCIVYLIKVNISFFDALYVTIGVTMGGVVGATVLNKLNGNVAKLIFALLLVFGGAKLVFF
ncbi:MAG: sulfite exporter TauE/SafE family protein [Clostridia bacterium]